MVDKETLKRVEENNKRIDKITMLKNDKRFEKIFRKKHIHGDILISNKNEFTYLTCSLWFGSIRILSECNNSTKPI